MLQKLAELVAGSYQQGGLAEGRDTTANAGTQNPKTQLRICLYQKNLTNLSWWIMREMASKRTAFFAFECWTFLDLGGSCALLRMVSRHSVRRLRRAASSATTKHAIYLITEFDLCSVNSPKKLSFSGLLVSFVFGFWCLFKRKDPSHFGLKITSNIRSSNLLEL